MLIFLCKFVRIFLLQKKKEPTKIGRVRFVYTKLRFISPFFLFCNSFAFFLFTRLPSTTTPTLSFLTRFQKKKKKTGICSNLNVLLCHPSITHKKKTKLRNIVQKKHQKKHDHDTTTHNTQHQEKEEAYLPTS